MKKTFILLSMVLIMMGSIHTEESYFEQAKKLYEKGPEYAAEVIQLLRKELEINPANLDARGWLAMTFFGVGDFARSLDELDVVIKGRMGKMEDNGETLIVPAKLIILRIRALVQLDRFNEARTEIRRYYAFISDEDHKAEYQKMTEELEYYEKFFFVANANVIIHKRENLNLDHFLFIPIRNCDVEIVKNDHDVNYFIIDKIDGRHPDFVNVLPHESEHNVHGFCVYFLDHKPYKIFKFEMAFYKNNSIDNEMVKKNLETIHENTYDNEDKCFQWEIGELKTDDGKTVLAFKKLPKKESQTDR